MKFNYKVKDFSVEIPKVSQSDYDFLLEQTRKYPFLEIRGDVEGNPPVYHNVRISLSHEGKTSDTLKNRGLTKLVDCLENGATRVSKKIRELDRLIQDDLPELRRLKSQAITMLKRREIGTYEELAETYLAERDDPHRITHNLYGFFIRYSHSGDKTVRFFLKHIDEELLKKAGLTEKDFRILERKFRSS